MEYLQLKEHTLNVTHEPLAGATLLTLLRLLHQNRFSIDLRYLPRVMYALSISSMLLPLRIKERVQFETRIQHTKILHDPVFILGHWRSGTTYLHNLFTMDSSFGYMSTLHATLPSVYLGGESFVKSFVTKSLPGKRPMDDVPMAPSLPQEDEFAIAAVSVFSANHGLCFPRNAQRYYQFLFMETVSQEIRDVWKETYGYLLKKETLACGGKQLVLKNPANTARVGLLGDMFPNAKFIHVHRNPYHVYQSMMKLLLSIIPYMCVQTPPEVSVVASRVLQVYKQMMTKYLKERTQIPQENLVEIRYEDFIQRPLEHMKQIYSTLRLPGFVLSENTFVDYIATQSKIKKQTYVLDEALKEKIYREWKFAFDAFQYEK